MIYVGILFGQFLCQPFFNNVNIKVVLLFALLFKAGSLFLLVLSTDIYLGLLSRFVTGFFGIFLYMYFPVWVDTFSFPRMRSLSLKVLLVVPFLGLVSGYTMTAYLTLTQDWKYSFFIQAGCMLPCILVFLLTPIKYLDIDSAVTL